jgi:hypothetical protein
MPRTYAALETKSADLATAFGLEWATKLFGEEAIASLPVRKSGKNKGAPKGFVIWRKATTSGWCREVEGPLGVGQLADAWIGMGFCTPRGAATAGQWLGRRQTLAASVSAGGFFEAGRARYAAERAKRESDWLAEKAEMTEAMR